HELIDSNINCVGPSLEWYGISLQPQSLERRDLSRQMRFCPRGVPTNCRSRVSHAPAGTASQRPVPLSGTGDTNPIDSNSFTLKIDEKREAHWHHDAHAPHRVRSERWRHTAPRSAAGQPR